MMVPEERPSSYFFRWNDTTICFQVHNIREYRLWDEL